MIDQSAPFERLRAANPVPRTQLASASSPAAVALLHRIVADETVTGREPAGVPPRRRLGRRLRLLVPVLVVAGVAIGAVYAVATRKVSKPQYVACFERADLAARTQVVSAGSGGPVAACAGLWAEGAFGDVPAPDLAACTLDSGAAGVFPTTTGTDVCRRLGLAAVPGREPSTTDLPPTTGVTSQSPAAPAAPAADENTQFLAFRDAVLPLFLDVPCMDPVAGEAIVRRELDRAGLSHWTLRIGQGVADGFSPDRPCATLAFRPAERAVVLVPAPPRR